MELSNSIPSSPITLRNPSLPKKLRNYLSFAFFFSNLLIENNLINPDLHDNILNLFHAFDNYDIQSHFFSQFILNSNSHFKSFKSFLKSRKPTVSPDAPSLSKKRTKKTKEPNTEKDSNNENKEKTKKPRKSKKIVEVTENTMSTNENNEDTSEQLNKHEKKPRKTNKEKNTSQGTEVNSDLIHQLLTLAISEDNE